MPSMVFVNNSAPLTLVGSSVPASVDTTLTRPGQPSCHEYSGLVDFDIPMCRLELGELPACLDHDECTEDNGGCDQNQDCVNTVGSHRSLNPHLNEAGMENNPLLDHKNVSCVVWCGV